MLPELRTLDLSDKVGMEVGGTGHGLSVMHRSNCRNMIHMEVSKETQRIAQENLAPMLAERPADITYINSPAERIPLQDASVDFLIAFGTYHHTDRQYSVPEIKRILKPGGLFFIHEAYIGGALGPFKWASRQIRTRWGSFEPGNDNPLGLRDIIRLKRLFPRSHYAVRHPGDILGFIVRMFNPKLAHRIYSAEVDLPGVTAISTLLLKGVLFFSGKKS
jgi:SAM-dependent methyltransferase